MIKFENTEVVGWEAAIRGMRNPLESWGKSDSYFECEFGSCDECAHISKECAYWELGQNDLDLIKRLRNAGTDHRKFMRMITVYVDITAPLYWWKEFDTYKVGTVANSCSTMHCIHKKEFTLEDFSTEHLTDISLEGFVKLIEYLNVLREAYLETKDKKYWWQMIQLLPSSYNQKRTVMMNYEVLANIYKSRKNHKLDEWKEHNPVIGWDIAGEGSGSNMGFCDWINTLPYSEVITGKFGDENNE